MKRSFGRELEFDVLLGHVSNQSYRKSWFIDFEDAIEIVIYKQPNNWNPLSPPTVLGKKLLDSVRDSLETELTGRCSQAEARSIVRSTGLYVALGTAADFWHHTDAIIGCDLGHVLAIVTIDLKMSDEDPRDLRDNHVVLTRDHFYELAGNGKTRLENISGVIAEGIVEQLESRGIISPLVLNEKS